jgi:galactokinase
VRAEIELRSVWAPGRVNLIGEHIDYHNLPVLPMALRQGIRVTYRPRADRRIRASSAGYGAREFEWTGRLGRVAAGDWENYLRAAAQVVSDRWGAGPGVDAQVAADLPPAAGLSSSSALIVAFTLCLLGASGREAGFEELMEVLPEGEHFVGTRGGGMDHAASLASRAGFASLVGFQPAAVRYVRVPEDWAFLVAHSMERAEKSGAVREAYNRIRGAGETALAKHGAHLSAEERAAYDHVTSESGRVSDAVEAMRQGDAVRFGQMLAASHASLRDRLHVSSLALDELVDTAMAGGALGARLTGAGFGGCAVMLSRRADRPRLRDHLIREFYAKRAGFEEAHHLIDAEPGSGALDAANIVHSGINRLG